MTQVVIGDILPYTQATAIAAQTVFGTNWTANAASDIVVYQTPSGDSPDDETQILQSSQYSVSFIGDLQQVQVTLVTPASAGDIITITRQTPADRENLYSNTNFTPSMLNNDFGILTLVDQQAQLVDQLIGPRYNYSAVITDVVDTVLPILGANQFWAKNSANDAIVALTIADIITGGTVTEVDTGLGLTGGPITVSGTISMQTTLPLVIQSNITQLGTQSQALDMGSNFIHNVSDPISAQDAVTKNYIDTVVFNEFLPLTGGTMSGIIDMGNHKITNLTNPSSAQDAATLNYVSTQLAFYLPLSGGTMTGLINMSSNKITSLTDPTNPQDAATKNYVDLVAQGLAVQPACFAATTANLTATYANGASGIGATLTNSGALAAFSVDGTSPATNARILVKDQSTTFQNGIYTVTNQGSGAVAWVLTRATDYDQPAEIQPGDLVIINSGTVNGGASFIETASVSAVGTDAILFSQFTFPPGAFLLKANNLSDVANKTTAFNNISPLTTKGDLINFDGTNNVRLAVGGTDGQIFQVSSGAATGLAWSTATYPSTTTVNRILFSSATNVVGQISSLAGGVLVTDASSVPQFLTNPSAANRIILSANAAIPTWSAYTMPTAAGSSGNVLTSDGTNWISATPTGSGTVNSGSQNQLAWYAANGTAVSGLATANNGILVTSSGGVPSISSTLPQAVINNFTAPTVQIFTSGSGTYSTPSNCKYIIVEMVGGGGGGGGSNNGTPNASAATASTFGSAFLSAGAGTNAANASGAAGGTSSGGDINITGGKGQGCSNGSTGTSMAGGFGGSSFFGGAGGGGATGNAGNAAATNSGSGGGGGATNANAIASGAGGGAGGYLKKLITSPSASYAYTVGTAGTGGTAGAGGFAGGNGGSGLITVYEFYT